MTTPEYLQALRLATCAVGYLKLPLDEYLKDPTQSAFEVIGSGFVIGRGLVFTCAHVVEDLDETVKKKRVPAEQIALQFVYPLQGTQWRTVYRRFRPFERQEGVDSLTLEYVPGDMPDLPIPRIVTRAWEPAIGEEVGLVGYPFGSLLLREGRRLWRFGPIFKRGVIAAMSPYDSPVPEELILDLAVGPAASGSPVFLTATGEVIGMLVKGQDNRHGSISVALALAADGRRVLVRKNRIGVIDLPSGT